jgi:hypothetical protein
MPYLLLPFWVLLLSEGKLFGFSQCFLSTISEVGIQSADKYVVMIAQFLPEFHGLP